MRTGFAAGVYGACCEAEDELRLSQDMGLERDGLRGWRVVVFADMGECESKPCGGEFCGERG